MSISFIYLTIVLAGLLLKRIWETDGQTYRTTALHSLKKMIEFNIQNVIIITTKSRSIFISMHSSIGSCRGSSGCYASGKRVNGEESHRLPSIPHPYDKRCIFLSDVVYVLKPFINLSVIWQL